MVLTLAITNPNRSDALSGDLAIPNEIRRSERKVTGMAKADGWGKTMCRFPKTVNVTTVIPLPKYANCVLNAIVEDDYASLTTTLSCHACCYVFPPISAPAEPRRLHI